MRNTSDHSIDARIITAYINNTGTRYIKCKRDYSKEFTIKYAYDIIYNNRSRYQNEFFIWIVGLNYVVTKYNLGHREIQISCNLCFTCASI